MTHEVSPRGGGRLDDQELTMETRRQSEKHLQKAREKERAQATRISDEEKRNSAITNAMKNWQVLKKDHKKLIRKFSESSTSEYFVRVRVQTTEWQRPGGFSPPTTTSFPTVASQPLISPNLISFAV